MADGRLSGDEHCLGAGEESCCRAVGDGEKTMASTERDFFNVGCIASSTDMRTETRVHIPCFSQSDCKPYPIMDTETSCEMGCEEAFEKEGCKIMCEGIYAHCRSSSQSECETPRYSPFCKADYAERPFVNAEVGKGEEACNRSPRQLTEAGDGESIGWMSPRISFSHDFAMVDMAMAGGTGITQSISSRLSPEKRKWDEQDDGSADFEFLRYAPTHAGAGNPVDSFMLSADELFSNGKLLPVPVCKHLVSRDDFYLPSTSDEEHQSQSPKLSIHKSSASRPMIRHLSFELSRARGAMSHVVLSSTSSPSRVSEKDLSSGVASGLHASMPTSVSKLASLVPSSSLTILPSPSPKCSVKLKAMFKIKKVSMDPLPSELSRDNSFTSTCRLPISPRSLWPFARSSSVCNNKSSTVCRCILETDAAHSNSISSENVDAIKGVKSCSQCMTKPMKVEGLMAPICEKTSTLPEAASTVEASNAESLIGTQADCHPPLDPMADALREHNASVVASKLRDSLSPSEGLMKKTSATSVFARGSPGRRGGTKKLNTGKIVLRNLERCSAEKRLDRDGWKGLSRRSTFCAATRVSPVLNVPIYRVGNASKSGFLSFGSLFSSRKNRKHTEPMPINWRKGA